MVLLTLYDGCKMFKFPIIVMMVLISAGDPIKTLLMKFE